MYTPNIRVKFIWRLYRVRNKIKQTEGRTLSFCDMTEEALSLYLHVQKKALGMSPGELPEVKLDGAWHYVWQYLHYWSCERRKILEQEKRIKDELRIVRDYKR